MNYRKLDYSKGKEWIILQEIENANSNVVVEIKNTPLKDLVAFAEKIIFDYKNFSLVFVYDNIIESTLNNIDIPLVPTLEEAEHYIEMEDIQRELGIDEL